MPSQWLSIDDNFPSFTGEESPKEQIRALHNYLYQLREGLQYSLQNLTTDNFNTAALKNLTNEQKDMVAEQLEKVYTLTSELSGQIEKLAGRVGAVEKLSGRVSDVESGLADVVTGVADVSEQVRKLNGQTQELSERADATDGAVTELGERIRTMEEDRTVETLGQAVQKLSGAVRVAEDGVTVGSAGKPLYLVGQVYINGAPYAQGEMT